MSNKTWQELVAHYLKDGVSARRMSVYLRQEGYKIPNLRIQDEIDYQQGKAPWQAIVKQCAKNNLALDLTLKLIKDNDQYKHRLTSTTVSKSWNILAVSTVYKNETARLENEPSEWKTGVYPKEGDPFKISAGESEIAIDPGYDDTTDIVKINRGQIEDFISMPVKINYQIPEGTIAIIPENIVVTENKVDPEEEDKKRLAAAMKDFSRGF